MEEMMEFDTDFAYESWRDNSIMQLEEETQELVERFLNHNNNYYYLKEDKLFEHLVQQIASLLGKQADFKRVGENFKRLVIEVN